MAMIIGREEQLDQIGGHIEAMASGSARANVLFVTGEAGIGKSTLLHAVIDRCRHMAHPPAWGLVECSTPLAGHDIGEVEALLPWAGLMNQLVAGSGMKEAGTRKLVADLAVAWVKFIPIVGDLVESVADTATILKEHRQGNALPGPASPAISQEQLFQQYINFLSRLSEETPLLLMIDDFHWADSSSTDLLFAAARQLQGKPILFVIAYRPDDAASSRNGDGHPILHIRRELERYDLAAEVGVPGMTPLDMDRLLRSRYPNYQNNDPFEEWLARVSGGNALFITRYLETLEEDGHIDRAAGRVREGYESASIPASAYAVVQERIQRLSAEAKELLRYASVEGDEFTSLVLARITEMLPLKLLGKLRQIEETHHVVRNLGKRRAYASETTLYRFSHSLIHRAMYESLAGEERELLHQMILDVLKSEWEAAAKDAINVPGIAARVAAHARVLGDHLFAATVMVKGARASWREFAEKETLRQVESGLESLRHYDHEGKISPGEAESRLRIETDLVALRASVHQIHGRFDEALADFSAARSLAEQAGDDETAINSLVNISGIHRVRGESAPAMEYARLALDRAGRSGNRLATGVALTAVGNSHLLLGETDQALDYMRRGYDVLGEFGETARQGKILSNIGNTLRRMGRLQEAEEHYRQSLALAQASGDRSSIAASMLNLGNLFYGRKMFAEALEHYYGCMKLADEIGHRELYIKATGNIGVVYKELGDLERARELMREVMETARRHGLKETEANALAELADIGKMISEREEGEIRIREQQQAERDLTAALEILRELDHADTEYYATRLEQLRERGT